jgi:hypothetical protein
MEMEEQEACRRMMPLTYRNNAEVMDVVFSSLRYHIGQDPRYSENRQVAGLIIKGCNLRIILELGFA